MDTLLKYCVQAEIAAVPEHVTSGSKEGILDGDKSDLSDHEGNSCCLKCCAPESRPGVAFIKLSFCCIAGIVFGWCMEKSRGNYFLNIETPFCIPGTNVHTGILWGPTMDHTTTVRRRHNFVTIILL